MRRSITAHKAVNVLRDAWASGGQKLSVQEVVIKKDLCFRSDLFSILSDIPCKHCAAKRWDIIEALANRGGRHYLEIYCRSCGAHGEQAYWTTDWTYTDMVRYSVLSMKSFSEQFAERLKKGKNSESGWTGQTG